MKHGGGGGGFFLGGGRAGGDWALQRSGAILLDHTEGVTIANSTMVRESLTQMPHANTSRKYFTQTFHVNISRMDEYRDVYVYVSVHTQERCDGNAIMVSGHNLGTLLAGNEIKWTGEEQRRTSIKLPPIFSLSLSLSPNKTINLLSRYNYQLSLSLSR